VLALVRTRVVGDRPAFRVPAAGTAAWLVPAVPARTPYGWAVHGRLLD
jgi:hypothetical protein